MAVVAMQQDVVQKPLHDYFIKFPGVSRWHWHPLTCLYPQGAAAGSVTFAMKEKGSWSQVSSLHCHTFVMISHLCLQKDRQIQHNTHAPDAYAYADTRNSIRMLALHCNVHPTKVCFCH